MFTSTQLLDGSNPQLLQDGTCKLSFSLNGSFVAPMGEAWGPGVPGGPGVKTRGHGGKKEAKLMLEKESQVDVLKCS